MKGLAGLNLPLRTTDPTPPEDGLTIYSKNGIVYSIDPAGLVEVITNIGGGAGGGSNDHIDLSIDAAQDILAYKIITVNTSGDAVYASSDNLDHVNRILGIAKGSVQTGHKVHIRNKGLLSNSGWSWTPNQILYLGLNGDITANPNIGLFSNSIGFAVTNNIILVNISRSIIRG